MFQDSAPSLPNIAFQVSNAAQQPILSTHSPSSTNGKLSLWMKWKNWCTGSLTRATLAAQAERQLLSFGGLLLGNIKTMPASAVTITDTEEVSLNICRSYYVHLGNGVMMNTLAVDVLNGIQDLDLKLNHSLLSQKEDDNTTSKDTTSKDTTSKTSDAPIVVAHGYGAGLGFFYKNLYAMSQSTGRRLYALDWLGMGRSSRPAFPAVKATLGTNDPERGRDFFLDALETWRQEQQLEKMILVGHSLGGYLACQYALKYPERVERLILVSPVGIPPKPEDAPVSSVSRRKLSNWVIQMWNNNYTPMWFIRTLGPVGPKLVNAYTNRRFSYLDPTENKALSDYLYQISADRASGEYALGILLEPGAWARRPLYQKLGELTVPTTFMYGEQDWMDFRHALRARIPLTAEQKQRAGGLDVFVVPNAGHHLYLDNPPEFNRLISAIIRGRTGTSEPVDESILDRPQDVHLEHERQAHENISVTRLERNEEGLVVLGRDERSAVPPDQYVPPRDDS